MELGKEHGFDDVTLYMQGKVVTGCRGIKYKKKRDSENIYSLGSKEPVAYSRGKAEYEGELMLLKSEFDALVASLPEGKDPTDLKPFDAVVVYAGADNKITKDIVQHIRLTEWEKAMKVEDQFMEITLPIVYGKVKLGVK